MCLSIHRGCLATATLYGYTHSLYVCMYGWMDGWMYGWMDVPVQCILCAAAVWNAALFVLC